MPAEPSLTEPNPWWLPAVPRPTSPDALGAAAPPLRGAPLRRERLTRPTATSSTSTGSRAAPARGPLVLILHGLEGSSRSHYALGLLRERRGARLAGGVVLNFRSCSGELNRLPQPLPLGRDVGPRLAGRRARRAGAGAAHRPGRRLARRQRRAQVARRAGGRGARRGPGGRRHLHAVRPGRVRRASSIGASPRCSTPRASCAPCGPRCAPRPAPLRRRAWTWPPRSGRGPSRSTTAFFTAPLNGFADERRLLGAREQRARILRAIRRPCLLINAMNDPFVPAASRCPRAVVAGSRWLRGGLRAPRAGTRGFSRGRAAAARGRSAAPSPSCGSHLRTPCGARLLHG